MGDTHIPEQCQPGMREAAVKNVNNNVKKRSNVNVSMNGSMSRTNMFGHCSVI